MEGALSVCGGCCSSCALSSCSLEGGFMFLSGRTSSTLAVGILADESLDDAAAVSWCDKSRWSLAGGFTPEKSCGCSRGELLERAVLECAGCCSCCVVSSWSVDGGFRLTKSGGCSRGELLGDALSGCGGCCSCSMLSSCSLEGGFMPAN